MHKTLVFKIQVVDDVTGVPENENSGFVVSMQLDSIIDIAALHGKDSLKSVLNVIEKEMEKLLSPYLSEEALKKRAEEIIENAKSTDS